MIKSVLRIAALLLVSKTGVLIAGMGLQCTVDSQCLEYVGYVTLFRSPVLPQDGGIIYVSHVFYIVSAQM